VTNSSFYLFYNFSYQILSNLIYYNDHTKYAPEMKKKLKLVCSSNL